MNKEKINYSSIEELKKELEKPEWSMSDFLNYVIPGGTKLMFLLYLEGSYNLEKDEYAKNIIEPTILSGEDVNAFNRQNNPTIIYAHSIETLDMLIQYGAKVDTLLDNKETLLDFYIRKASLYGLENYEKMLTYLIKKGLRPTEQKISHFNATWLTPLLEKIELSDIVEIKSSAPKIKI